MDLGPPGENGCIYYKLGLTSGGSSTVKEKRNELCKNEMLDNEHGGMATFGGEFKNSKSTNFINSRTKMV